jgi:pilus assembly protein CpaB
MRGIIVTALAALCGISAVIGANQWRNSQAPAGGAVETVDVIVAMVEIAPYEQIKKELLGIQKWPKANVPPGAVLNVEEVLDWYSMGMIIAGEPLIKAKLSNQPMGLTAKINTGMRAISVLTPNYSSSVAGLIMPGHRVDVLLTRKGSTGKRAGGFSETLLQNVMILAVDRQIRPDVPGGEQSRNAKQVQSVTLEVSPPQAERLSSAQLEGEIALVLRGANDNKEVEIEQPKPVYEQQDVLMAAFDKLQASLLKKLEPKPAPAVAAKPEPVAVAVTNPDDLKPIDTPVYTLRGNAWGYVMSRQPIPRVPGGSRSNR